ncbi:MAG: fibronectin type III domain-containing protein [Patescibacteria group bacterium]
MKSLGTLLILISVLCWPFSLLAQSVMSSNLYGMHSDSINFAGTGASSTSANYGIEFTAGENGSGLSSGTNYGEALGFQYMFIDTSVPTAPSTLTTQIISSSEVELSWNAGSDNYGVERYYIYRDNVRITDVASFPRDYNDTGLTAETTYLYNVSAVDIAGNESLRTATSTVTTPVAPATSSSSGTPSGTRNVIISDFNISSNDTSASISFKTNLPRKADIYWGRDLSYGDGHLSSPGLFVGSLSSYSFVAKGLSPQTFYHIKIVLTDDFGNERTYENISFRTLAVALSQSPANVSSFRAVSSQSTIELSWKLPSDKRVVGVKLLRSKESYPSNSTDGEVIFENRDGFGVESFSDKTVVTGTEYYYAIFTEDLAGNLSSGVLAQSKILLPGEIEPINLLDKLLPAGNVDPKIDSLSIKDFLFIQSGDSIDVLGDSVGIRGDKNLTVALKYYRVPPVLKTIAVTLLTQGNSPERFTFILRPNRDKTRYEATIGGLGDPKNYGLRVDIIDFKNQGLKTLRGVLKVEGPVSQLPIVFPSKTIKLLGLGVFGVLILIIAGYIIRRSKRKLPLVNTTRVTMSEAQ